MLKTLIIVGSGSFIGGIARYLASQYIQNNHNSDFPWGTFGVNIAGCFAFGLFFGLFERWGACNPEWRNFLLAGFCGGFTTFSAFAGENIGLLKDGNYLYFLLYTGLSVFLGLSAVVAGMVFMRMY